MIITILKLGSYVYCIQFRLTKAQLSTPPQLQITVNINI